MSDPISRLIAAECRRCVRWIHGLPGGQGALVVLQGVIRQLVALDLRDGSTVSLVDDVVRAWYAHTGHLVYHREGQGPRTISRASARSFAL